MYFSGYPLIESFLIPFVFGLIAFALRAVSRSGLIGGVIAGTLIYYLAGMGGFWVLGSFFIIGSLLTKFGYRAKEARGIAQADKGRRGARHALANTAIPLGLALIYKLTGHDPTAGALITAAFATACADTSGTELGSALGKRAFLPTTFRRVEPGTPGAVSLEGTLASLAGAFIVAGVGWKTGIVENGGFFLAAATGGFLGAWMESVLGAVPGVEKAFGNEGMNVANTVIGAFFCLVIVKLIGL